MTPPEEKESGSLYTEILKADLNAYRRLETWGSSLFLGALGLIAKQFVDWDFDPEPAKRIALTAGMGAFPAAVGFVAFVFLRVVNFRSHWSRRKLLELAGRPAEESRGSWGVLGVLLAIMPLLLGYAASWFLAFRRPEMHWWMVWLTIVGGIVLVAALTVHCYVRRSMNPAGGKGRTPAGSVVTIFLALVAGAHLVRAVLRIEVMAAGILVPVWMSVVMFLFTGGLAIMLWRESRR